MDRDSVQGNDSEMIEYAAFFSQYSNSGTEIIVTKLWNTVIFVQGTEETVQLIK